VAGKTAVVEPPDPNNPPNRDDDKLGHTDGHSQEDNRCSRPVVGNSPEIMKVIDLEGTLLSRAGRSP
jgi:hypothetical protein